MHFTIYLFNTSFLLLMSANSLERPQSLELSALASQNHGKAPGSVISQYLLALHVQKGHFQSQNCAALLRPCGHTGNRTPFSSPALQESPTSEDQQTQDPASHLARW